MPSTGCSRRRLLLVLVLLACFAAPYEARAAYNPQVPSSLILTVRETAGIARNGEVIRSGVPMPRSLNLRSTASLALVDAAGTPVPAEFEVTARWNAAKNDANSPIQWLLVTFPASVGPRATATYRVVTNGSVANPAPARPLTLTQNGNIVTVDTGAAVFRLGASPGALFDEVLLDNGTRVIGGSAMTARVNGAAAGHPTIRKVKIEHAGPLTAIVIIEGAYDAAPVGNGGFGSFRRYVFTAGSPTAVVRQSAAWEGNLACNGCIETPAGAPNGVLFEQVRDTLSVELGSGARTVTAVADFDIAAVTGSVSAGQTAAIRQILRSARTEPLRYEANIGGMGGTAASGARATGGVLAASGPAGAVAIALNRMDRYEPQALRLLADGSFAIDVADGKAWVAHHQGLYATLAVSALPSGPSRATLDRAVWAPLNRPLRAWPQAAWFAASDAVDEFPVGPLPAEVAAYDTLIPSVLNRTTRKIDELGLAGLMTYGVYPRYWGKDGAPGEIDCAGTSDPTPGETWDNTFWCSNWADYHNTASTAPIWAMRTGQVEWLDDLATPAALRMLHTQIMQCGPNDGWSYCGQAPAGYGGYRADFNSSHAYWDNLFLYYWLTGDQTVVDTVRRGAQSMRRLLCSSRASGGGACSPDAPQANPSQNFTGRVSSQWHNAFRFVGLASDDGSFLDDYRSGMARAATQHYVEATRNGVAYGFLGDRAVIPGTYQAGPMWMNGFYDANILFRLQRDTGDAPIGIPALPPSRIIAATARTLRDLEPTVMGDGTVDGDWPKSLEYTYATSRLGGALTAVLPFDRPIFGPEKTSVTALFLRAGEQSGDAALYQKGREMVQYTLSAAAGEGAPLGKLQGQYLTRLHSAVARLAGGGSAPPPPPAVPAAPSGLQAQAVSGSEIQLSWTDNAGNEESFRIEALNQLATFQEILVVGANTAGARITGLAAGGSYTFRVRAANAGGLSAASNTAAVTTPLPPPLPTVPAAPSGFAAQAVSGTEVQLNWTDNAGNEDGFRVEAINAQSVFQEIRVLAANATGVRITGLTAGGSYTFRVRAANAAGFSGYSNTATVTTPRPTSTAPAAPNTLTAQALSSTEVQLNWRDNSTNEASFRIERLVNGLWVEIASVGGNTTSALVSALQGGASYSFRVRAANSVGYSAYSNTVAVTTPATTGSRPAAPSGVTAQWLSGGYVQVSWRDNSNNEQRFLIEKLVDGVWQHVGASAANTATLRVSLKADATFTLRAVANNADGSSPSGSVTVNTF
ncbi:MAG TPA: fibronectin type III domain-containing protein [Thermoanaerobaculia bacterium]|nr:fibronectin type III domain-containing protein [Thermoanaerobaculia bacterium]